MSLDAPERYVRLALQIDRLLPGYVDAYFGPAEWQKETEGSSPPALRTLENEVQSLEDELKSSPALGLSRRSYLQEMLRAMRTTLTILGGGELDIGDEVEQLYGISPRWVDESIFLFAHRQLDALLPGPGSLQKRVMDFRIRSRVPGEMAIRMIRRMMGLLRTRTSDLFDLDLREGCEITFVQDQSWMAYNRYLGNGRSSIEFNLDVPIELWSLPSVVAHETYPGHHTENIIKEHRLYRQEDRVEHAVVLSSSPAATVMEGIAENALEVALSMDEIDGVMQSCYEDAGLPTEDARRALEFRQVYRTLDRVIENQVLLLQRDRVSDEEFIAYGSQYGLADEADGRHLLRFCRDPLSRSYAFNYTLGRELVAAFLQTSRDPTAAFWRLLSEPFTPGRLRQLNDAR